MLERGFVLARTVGAVASLQFPGLKSTLAVRTQMANIPTSELMSHRRVLA